MAVRQHCLALWLGLLVAVTGLGADPPPSCAVCQQALAGKYFKLPDGRLVCSEACAKQTLPRCAACGQPVGGSYFTVNDKTYCSKKCLGTVLPACEGCQRPIEKGYVVNGHRYCAACVAQGLCNECNQPAKGGVKLNDGRYLCPACKATAITDDRQARELLLKARDALRELTEFQPKRVPKLLLIDEDKLYARAGRPFTAETRGQLRGLYLRDERLLVLTDGNGQQLQVKRDLQRKAVLLLRGMTRDHLLVTAVHESAHDLLAEFFPRLDPAPAWVQEGVPQYLAAIYARRNKLAPQLLAIEKHPDADYGGGYRHLRGQFGDDDWPALRRWLESLDPGSLPAKCPTP